MERKSRHRKLVKLSINIVYDSDSFLSILHIRSNCEFIGNDYHRICLVNIQTELGKYFNTKKVGRRESMEVGRLSCMQKEVGSNRE